MFTSSAFSINSCFSSAYINYLIVVSPNAHSTAANLNFRVRASGADLSTGTYYYGWGAASSAGTGSNGGGAASTSVMFFSSGAQITDSNLQLWIGNPFASDETTFNFQGSWRQSTPLSIGVYGGGFVNNTTSYDGFSLIPSAGTITGTVRIYGVRN